MERYFFSFFLAASLLLGSTNDAISQDSLEKFKIYWSELKSSIIEKADTAISIGKAYSDSTLSIFEGARKLIYLSEELKSLLAQERVDSAYLAVINIYDSAVSSLITFLLRAESNNTETSSLWRRDWSQNIELLKWRVQRSKDQYNKYCIHMGRTDLCFAVEILPGFNNTLF